MSKAKFLLTLLLIGVFIVPVYAQGWEMERAPNYVYDGVFADTTAEGDMLIAGGHGIVVDKNGLIWMGSYWGGSTGGIVVLNPDGSHASFSPIASVAFADTTFDMMMTGSCRGMTVDADGNILYCHSNTLIKINPDDGTGMAYWEGPGSLTKPGVDSEGYIYVGTVVGVGPIHVLDPSSFDVTQEITLDDAPSYGRGLEVTPDGKTLITANLSAGDSPVPIYTTTNYVDYPKTDSISIDMYGKSIFKYQKVTMDWGPEGKLWISHDDSYAATGQPYNGFVVVDLDNKKYSNVYIPMDSTEYNGPRGISFNATGDTAYTISWNGNRVYRFVAGETLTAGDWTFDDGLVNYSFEGVFADTTEEGDMLIAGGHGIITDKNDRIWMGSYWPSAPGGIVVLNHPDGTPASFSPIASVAFADTTFDMTMTGSCRGMTVDMDGNILYAHSNTLIKINVEDGTGMAYWEGPGSLTKPGVDSEGYIYVGTVVGISPVYVLDPSSFDVTQEITLDDAPSYGRGLEVSTDGKTLISANLSSGASPVPIYSTTNYVDYPKTDSIYTDISGLPIFDYQKVTMDWGPDGYLWISEDDSYAARGKVDNGFVVVDLENKKYDYVHVFLDSTEYNGPRGISFIEDDQGVTGYAISFNGNRTYKFSKITTGIGENQPIAEVPRNFELKQNYPNPFNPTTTIPFALEKRSKVELKVFNIRGRVVKTLIEKALPAGRHAVEFDATGFASGVYYYRLKVDDQMLTKKMMLVK